MREKAVDAQTRSKRFAIEVIRFTKSLPPDDTARIIGRQLVRSAMSVGANWRAAHRAKSVADMVNKFKIVEEECDESAYWLELLEEAGYSSEQTRSLLKESNELLRIVVASITTLKAKDA